MAAPTTAACVGGGVCRSAGVGGRDTTPQFCRSSTRVGGWVDGLRLTVHGCVRHGSPSTQVNLQNLIDFVSSIDPGSVGAALHLKLWFQGYFTHSFVRLLTQVLPDMPQGRYDFYSVGIVLQRALLLHCFLFANSVVHMLQHASQQLALHMPPCSLCTCNQRTNTHQPRPLSLPQIMVPDLDAPDAASLLPDLSAALCLRGVLATGASVQLRSLGLASHVQGRSPLQAWAAGRCGSVHKLHVPMWTADRRLLELLAAMPMLRTLCVDNRTDSAMSDVGLQHLCATLPGVGHTVLIMTRGLACVCMLLTTTTAFG